MRTSLTLRRDQACELPSRTRTHPGPTRWSGASTQQRHSMHFVINWICTAADSEAGSPASVDSCLERLRVRPGGLDPKGVFIAGESVYHKRGEWGPFPAPPSRTVGNKLLSPPYRVMLGAHVCHNGGRGSLEGCHRYCSVTTAYEDDQSTPIACSADIMAVSLHRSARGR